MKGIKVAIIIFSTLCVLAALVSVIGFAFYFYYGAMDMSADASGGGPVGLPYLFATMAGGAVGIYAAILAGVNAVVVLILALIRRRKEKRENSFCRSETVCEEKCHGNRKDRV